MGFLRMQQKNFGGAISYLTEAEQDGYKARTVENALATSRFWFTMAEATQAFDENQLAVAEAKYKAALDMNPRSPEALNGLAGLLTKEQKYPQAAGVYEQLIKVQPNNLDGWRGLFLSYARDHQNQKALATAEHYPAAGEAGSRKRPGVSALPGKHLSGPGPQRGCAARARAGSGAAVPRQRNRPQDRYKVAVCGHPDGGQALRPGRGVVYADLNEDRSNLSAWLGLVSAHHEQGQDTQAIADVQKMPPATYEAALGDPGFLSLLGAIYQQANQLEVAQGLLERSEKLQTAAGGQPSVALELQLAGIYLLRNNTAQAYDIYNRVLKANPDRADAWKGLISTLAATNRNAQALRRDCADSGAGAQAA